MNPADVTVDARGMLCPRPVIELARAARELGTGVIEVLADDVAAAADIPAWCRMRQAELLATEPAAAGATRYLVRVGDQPNAGASASAEGSAAR